MGVGYDGGLGMTLTGNRASVVVIGGGLAGISAAIGLADAGLDVTLLEARPWLGGATCSFVRRGLTIDNGQHVFLRCCIAYRDLLARLGVTGVLLTSGPAGPDGARSGRHRRLRRSGLPAPLHLARSLSATGCCPCRAREGCGRGDRAAVRRRAGRRRPQPGDWLARHGQSEHARENALGPAVAVRAECRRRARRSAAGRERIRAPSSPAAAMPTSAFRRCRSARCTVLRRQRCSASSG